eukprot:GHVS01031858.1.p1 GENE.GHVS01031858.1~~GHVS01031858.1.p1  ORF type:complete len:808 (+),score=212.53 GHVS01031858.1:38-2461(+)
MYQLTLTREVLDRCGMEVMESEADINSKIATLAQLDDQLVHITSTEYTDEEVKHIKMLETQLKEFDAKESQASKLLKKQDEIVKSLVHRLEDHGGTQLKDSQAAIAALVKKLRESRRRVGDLKAEAETSSRTADNTTKEVKRLERELENIANRIQKNIEQSRQFETDGLEISSQQESIVQKLKKLTAERKELEATSQDITNTLADRALARVDLETAVGAAHEEMESRRQRYMSRCADIDSHLRGLSHLPVVIPELYVQQHKSSAVHTPETLSARTSQKGGGDEEEMPALMDEEEEGNKGERGTGCQRRSEESEGEEAEVDEAAIRAEEKLALKKAMDDLKEKMNIKTFCQSDDKITTTRRTRRGQRRVEDEESDVDDGEGEGEEIEAVEGICDTKNKKNRGVQRSVSGSRSVRTASGSRTRKSRIIPDEEEEDEEMEGEESGKETNRDRGGECSISSTTSGSIINDNNSSSSRRKQQPTRRGEGKGVGKDVSNSRRLRLSCRQQQQQEEEEGVVVGGGRRRKKGKDDDSSKVMSSSSGSGGQQQRRKGSSSTGGGCRGKNGVIVRSDDAMYYLPPDCDVLENIDMGDLESEVVLLERQRDAIKQPDLRAIDAYKEKWEECKAKDSKMREACDEREKNKRVLDQLVDQRTTMFMVGFKQVARNLKEMYQIITQRGDAELELVDSTDPFTEGISFSVRPPKKSWKQIQNLSGGEKTLSSLALVFALHKLKPTPLYFMDEIDAALDCCNVSIIATYLKNYTKNAQFIIISLRDQMFEHCNRMIGIYKTQDVTKSRTIDPDSYGTPNEITQ